ncbi:hypothetical protein SDC9_59901 [bioreactor metagenome]|uniref:Uncharacterized protein n=1 Tax=bioreactor metagenome TaxID=1076179 RepID=A0A644XHF0_9ZZZZ
MIAEIKAVPALFHDEGRNAAGADIGRCHGKDHISIRLGGVCNKNLIAAEKVMVALVQGGGLGAARVGACVGLRQAEGAQLLSLTQGGQILFLLSVGAEGEDGPCPQGGVGGQNYAGAPVHPGQFLHRDGIAGEVQPRAAKFLGKGDTHESQLS